MRSVFARQRKQDPHWLFRQLYSLEALVFLCAAVAGLLLLITLYDSLTGALVVHDAATQLAGTLREAQAVARNQNQFITVSVVPASPGQPAGYRLQSGFSVLKQKKFPGGISGKGAATFDPHGVPLSPTSFHVRKGSHELMVIVDAKGLIAVP